MDKNSDKKKQYRLTIIIGILKCSLFRQYLTLMFASYMHLRVNIKVLIQNEMGNVKFLSMSLFSNPQVVLLRVLIKVAGNIKNLCEYFPCTHKENYVHSCSV